MEKPPKPAVLTAGSSHLSGFRSYNDDCGFTSGNDLLREFGALAREVFGTDLVTRIYADQFAVFYEGEDIAEKVTQLHRQALQLRKNFSVWMNAGAYFAGTLSASTYSFAVDYAKAACDLIPDDGRQYFKIYTDELRRSLARRRYITTHVDEAIERGWLRLYFQPIVRALTGHVAGFEALARWVDPTFGMISPGEFVPALEQKNLSWKLALFVIEETAATVSRMLQSGQTTVPISFNLSPRDFDAIDPFEELEQVMTRYRVPRDKICIEITESTAMQHPDRIRRVIGQFHDAGYQVWMDDFGSAYSSLNALKDFDFDVIKLDMVFMQNLSAKSKRIIESCIHMADEIGVRTLCEGAERKDQADFLRSCGCGRIQGYYYSRPLPLCDIRTGIATGRFVLEHPAEAALYDALQGTMPEQGSPFGIFSRKDGALRPLSLSARFARQAKKLGWKNPARLLPLSGSESAFSRRILEAAELSQNNKAPEELTFFGGGRCVLLGTTFLGQADGESLILIRLQDLPRRGTASQETARDRMQEALLSICESFYQVLPEQNRIEVIKSGAPGELPGATLPLSEEMFGARLFWQDRAAFADFFSRDSLYPALAAEKGPVAGTFRFLSPDGTLSKKTILVLHSEELPVREFFLALVPAIREEAPAKEETARAGTKEAALLAALLGPSGTSCYWADGAGRILGASLAFLARVGKTEKELIGTRQENLPVLSEDGALEKAGKRVLSGQVPAARVPVELLRAGLPVPASAAVLFLPGRAGESAGTLTLLEENNAPRPASIPQTRVEGARSFFTGIEAMESRYRRDGRDYCVGVFLLGSYWKIRASFGQASAEALAERAGALLAAAVPGTCLVRRISSDSFYLLEESGDVLRLGSILEAVSGKLLGVSRYGAFQGGVICRFGCAARQESANYFRTLELAASRASLPGISYSTQAQRHVNAELTASPAEEPLVLTGEQFRSRQAVLRRVFDIVRTVDPRTRKVLVYAKDGCHEEEGQSCYDFWQQGQACINCISSKAYQEKTSLAKLEFLNTSMFVVISRYLEVDGRGLVLELIKQLTAQSYLDQNEHEVLLRALTASRNLLYEDTLTGAHNQRYYEELLSGQTACAAALIELTNRHEIADKYGPEATEEALTREIGAALSCVRSDDLVVPGDGFLLLTFTSILPETFRSRLLLLHRSIRDASSDRFPALSLCPAIGGVCQKDKVSRLVARAKEALAMAKEQDPAVCVLEESAN